MNKHNSFALLSVLVLVGCSGGGQRPHNEVTYLGETVELHNGYFCSETNKYEMRERSGETHRCYFALSGLGYEQYDTAGKRENTVTRNYRALCREVIILTDERAPNKVRYDRNTPELQRVGLNCKPNE